MKKILLVEDQKFLIEPLTQELQAANFEVIQAFDGKQGLDLAISTHPDLILLDIIMPVMDGITMLKNLRLDDWGKTAQVIILTNLTNPEMLESARTENVADYLIKSNWEMKDVVNMAKQLLNVS